MITEKGLGLIELKFTTEAMNDDVSYEWNHTEPLETSKVIQVTCHKVMFIVMLFKKRD